MDREKETVGRRFLTREYSYCVLTKDEGCCCGRTAHQVDAHNAWAQMWKFLTRLYVYDVSTGFGEIDTSTLSSLIDT